MIIPANKKMKTQTLVVAADATAGGEGAPLTFTVDLLKSSPSGKLFARKFVQISSRGDIFNGRTISDIRIESEGMATITVISRHRNEVLSVSAGEELSVPYLDTDS